MQDLIADFGYIAIFIGTFLEGESVLALGGVAAAHGYLSFTAVVAVAIVGGFLGDQTCFWLGRRYGSRVLERYPGLAAKAPRVQNLLRRWDAMAVIVLRFCYGLRIAGPIIIGTCGISPWRLAPFNLICVLILGPLVAAVRYAPPTAIELWPGRRHLRLWRAGQARRELHADHGRLGRRHGGARRADPDDDLARPRRAADLAAHRLLPVRRHVRRRRRHALYTGGDRSHAAQVSFRARGGQHPARA